MDNKDLQRAEKFAYSQHYDAISQAEKQCKLIKNPAKAWNRMLACKQFATGDNTRKMKVCASMFFDRACELGHERALAFKEVRTWRRQHAYKLKIARKQQLMRPVAEALVKKIEKRVNVKCRISTMSDYPYWNNDGLFITTDYIADAPNSGYNSSGPERITHYRRSYLGSTLSKIATIVKKHPDCEIYKSHAWFIMLRFPR